MVECEFISALIIAIWGIVLIDTWWNVNFFKLTEMPACFSVLIDTWWNVNLIRQYNLICSCNSFNRYMVECESYYFALTDSSIPGFNRYMVECE